MLSFYFTNNLTILNEERNCHFYEKLGYTKTDNKIKVNEKMTLIDYIKKDNINKLHAVAKALLEKEKLEGAEFAEIFENA